MACNSVTFTIQMINMKRLLAIGVALFTFAQQAISQQTGSDPSTLQDTSHFSQKHRPQFHFSPKSNWMNDPNGMVYYNGTYHLFFQHFPEKTVWGPMHWGHATSTDLFHWQEQPIALYPDSLGYIFSGSAVVDFNNTTGFGKKGKPAMVAIFTHHNDQLEKLKQNNHQYQSIAYSNDSGKIWIKYSGNPVLKNPGIADFRDPKVMWFEKDKKWIMTLATKDRITFYASPDLKTWTKQSEFGASFGAHGGVWECPDLFKLTYDGKDRWVLLVSINPGGPNGGSVTQYFTGQFDGKTFTPADTLTRWMDVGPDNYAGVTFSNTGNRRILIGWMSNWLYANKVPTTEWRSAMTIPRELSLVNINGKAILAQKPVKELSTVIKSDLSADPPPLADQDITGGRGNGLYRLSFDAAATDSISVILWNSKKQQVVIGYDPGKKEFYIDRTNSGSKGFSNEFFQKSVAQRNSTSNKIQMTLVIDHASVELFADEGSTVMTAIFFPDEILKQMAFHGSGTTSIKNFQLSTLRR
jgi:fructan beta-fructosidase